MDLNRIWILIGKKLSGEASTDELKELEVLMNQGLGDIYPLHILEELWHSHPLNPPYHFNKSINEKWLRFESKLIGLQNKNTDTDLAIYLPKQKKTYRNAILASIIGLCIFSTAIAFWYFANHPIDDSRITQIAAPANGVSRILLPDGTKVWLNAGSKLVYKSHFGDRYRMVTLTGEAFFDVVKDANHPFIVTTSSFSLKVLGTAFNVRSYPNDKTSEAALVRGKIEVTLLKNTDKKLVLRPSEKLTVKNFESNKKEYQKKLRAVTEETPLITLSNIHTSPHDSLPAEALWLENKLAFDADTFEDVARKMERWYKISITFKNEKVKDLRFTGEFKNESLYTALTSLQSTAPFHFNIKNKQILIY